VRGMSRDAIEREKNYFFEKTKFENRKSKDREKRKTQKVKSEISQETLSLRKTDCGSKEAQSF
jgi:hypothetical protein